MGYTRRGNCYVTCEALFHLLGGTSAGYTPRTVRHEGDVHWYLVHLGTYARVRGLGRVDVESFVTIVDPTARQFDTTPPYHLGRSRGFLTKTPSKRAREMMEKMLWQDNAGTTQRGGRGAGGRTRSTASTSRPSARRKK